MLRSITVRIKAVFRDGDEDAATVLCLAAAANDIQTLARMLLSLPEDEAANTTRRYALRMGAMHLFEIRELVADRRFERAVKRSSRNWRCRDLPEHASELRRQLNSQPLRDVMYRVRNSLTGHYDREQVEEALALVGDSELMDLPGRGMRHDVVDRLCDVSFAAVSHESYRRDTTEASYRRALESILDAQHAIIAVIQGLVAGLYLEAQGY